MSRPITGVIEKCFVISEMLRTWWFVTVKDVMRECCISRSVANKYLVAASTILPVVVENEQMGPHPYRYTLMEESGDA